MTARLLAYPHHPLNCVRFPQPAFSPPHFIRNLRALMSKEEKRENAVNHLFNRLKENIGLCQRRTQSLRGRVISIIQTHVPGGRDLSTDYLNGSIDTLLTTTTIAVLLYSLHLSSRRYRTVDDIPISLVRRQGRINALVTSVGDGDNLRVRHIPIINIPSLFRKPDKRTISIRLAAIDAPECAHGIRPGQPYGTEAKQWLNRLANGKQVHIHLHSIDQYRRVIGTVFVKHENPVLKALGLASKNAGLELTRAGYATLYKGANAKYGGSRRLAQYIRAENSAQLHRRGMWKTPREELVLPGEFKKMIREGSGSATNTRCDPPTSSSENDNLTRLLKVMMGCYQWFKQFR